MSCENPSAGQGMRNGRATGRVCWGSGLVLALGSMVAGCAAHAGSGADFPNPPRQSPVTSVLVSADGRVITGSGPLACGHDPRLVARSFPRKVTLVWVSPDTNCNAEVLQSVVVRVRLPEPLGNRPLVQASGAGPVPYFDQRDLARVTQLPSGFRPSSEFPSAWPVDDTRIYAGPPGTVAVGPGWPCPCAQLQIDQRVGPAHPLSPTWPWPGHVRVHGRVAALLVERSGGKGTGRVYSRSIAWVDHGYRFVLNISVQGGKQVPLSNADLTAVADGIQLPHG